MVFLQNKILNVFPPTLIPPPHIHLSAQGDAFNFSFWKITKGFFKQWLKRTRCGRRTGRGLLLFFLDFPI